MVEMFYGTQVTNEIFSSLLDNINDLRNLVSVDIGIHRVFDTRGLTLKPCDLFGVPIPVVNNYRVNYWLTVYYPDGLSMPELIQSTKVAGP